jgi:geranylgeranyl diphosphate synthase type II
MKPKPRNLYEPIHYFRFRWKRMRPVLTLMSAEVLMPIIKKALPAALAVEVFIFSLVHDDIMDDAPCEEDTKRCMKNGISTPESYLVMRC